MAEYFENVPCPVCGQNQYKKVFKINHQDIAQIGHQLFIPAKEIKEFRRRTFLVECKNCSHTFVQPQLRKNILAGYYALQKSGYYEKLGATNLYSKRNLKIIKDIESFVPSGKLLEIGCGTGDLIRHLSSKWQIYGIEPSKWAVEYLQKRRVRGTFINDMFSKAIYPDGFFDVVVLIDVIEHIQQPIEFISSVWLSMRPMGILVILTGDSGSSVARILQSHWGYLRSVDHYSIFNKWSLTYLLERSGFGIIRSRLINHNSIKIALKYQFRNVELMAKGAIKRFLNRKEGTIFLAGLLDHSVVYARKCKLRNDHDYHNILRS